MSADNTPAPTGKPKTFDVAQFMSDAHKFSAEERERHDASESHIPLLTELNDDVFGLFRNSLMAQEHVPSKFRKQTDNERRMSALGPERQLRCLVLADHGLR